MAEALNNEAAPGIHPQGIAEGMRLVNAEVEHGDAVRTAELAYNQALAEADAARAQAGDEVVRAREAREAARLARQEANEARANSPEVRELNAQAEKEIWGVNRDHIPAAVQGQLDYVTANINSTEINEANDRAAFFVWGSEGTNGGTYYRQSHVDGEPIVEDSEVLSGRTSTGEERTAVGHVDEMRNDPQYGRTRAERAAAAQAYEEDVLHGVADGQELVSAVILADMHADREPGILDDLRTRRRDNNRRIPGAELAAEYERDVRDEVEAGLPLAQAKLLADLRLGDEERLPGMVANHIRQGMNGAEAESAAVRQLDRMHRQRRRLIVDEGLYTMDEYRTQVDVRTQGRRGNGGDAEAVPLPDSEMPLSEDPDEVNGERNPFDEDGRGDGESAGNSGPGDGDGPGEPGPRGPETGRRSPERNPDGSWSVKYEPLTIGANGHTMETPVQEARRWDTFTIGREFDLSWRARNYTSGVDNPVIIRVGRQDSQDEEDDMHIFLMQDQAYRIVPDEGVDGGYRAEGLGPIEEGTTAEIGGILRGMGWARAGGYRVLGVEAGGEMVDDAYDSQRLEGHVPGGRNQLLVDRLLVDRDVRHTGLALDRGRHGFVQPDPRGQGFTPDMFPGGDPYNRAATLQFTAEDEEARARAGEIAARQRQENLNADYPPLLLAQYADGIRGAQAEQGGTRQSDEAIMAEARRRLRRDQGGRRGLRRALEAEQRGDELQVGQRVPGRAAQAAARARRAAGQARQRLADEAVQRGYVPRVGGGDIMTDPGDDRLLRERGRVAAGLGALAARVVEYARRDRSPQETTEDDGEGGARGGSRPQRQRRERRGQHRRRTNRAGAMDRLNGVLDDGGTGPDGTEDEPQ